jgi:hypothetical protein
MDRKIRKSLLEDLIKAAQETDDDEDVSSFMGDFLPYDEGQFGNHEVFMEDFTTRFRPKDINQAIAMSNNSNWITIPEVARRKGFPHLYVLDPGKATPYERYFGVKTEYGYLDTPATAALRAAVFNPGKVHRFEANQPMLEIPPDYSSLPSGTKFMILDPQAEQSVIANASRIMEGAQGRPEHIRRVKIDETGAGEFTSTHGGDRPKLTPGMAENDPELDSKLKHLDTAIDRFYKEDKDGGMQLRRLHSTVARLRQILDSKIDGLVSEQRDKNRALRFEFKKEEYDDLIKQALLRIIIAELTGEGSPFEGTDLGLLQ